MPEWGGCTNVTRKRREAGDMEATGAVPEMLPTNQVYLDGPALFRDIADYAESDRLAVMSKCVALNRDVLRRLRDANNASIWLETYARLCAILEKPYGSWLKVRKK